MVYHVTCEDKLVIGVEFVESYVALWDFPSQWEDSYGEGDEEDEKESRDG